MDRLLVLDGSQHYTCLINAILYEDSDPRVATVKLIFHHTVYGNLP